MDGSSNVETVRMKVEVRKHRTLKLRRDNQSAFLVHGEADLAGTRVPHEEDEWRAVFPDRNGWIAYEDLLNAFWDKDVLVWDVAANGTKTSTFKST